MKAIFLLPALLSAAFVTTLCAATSEEMRAEVEKLVEQAKQAKAQGRNDEAQALMDRAKAIKIQVRDQLEAAGGAPPASGNIEAAKREAEQVRQKVDELRRAGKVDEATQLERKFDERNRLAAVGSPDRLNHLLQAIEHLRAAGLNEPAEDLSRMADKMRAELEHRDPNAGGPPPDRTQNALRELREAALKTERERNDMRLIVSKLEGQLDQLKQRLEQMEKIQRQSGERPAKPGGE